MRPFESSRQGAGPKTRGPLAERSPPPWMCEFTATGMIELPTRSRSCLFVASQMPVSICDAPGVAVPRVVQLFVGVMLAELTG